MRAGGRRRGGPCERSRRGGGAFFRGEGGVGCLGPRSWGSAEAVAVEARGMAVDVGRRWEAKERDLEGNFRVWEEEEGGEEMRYIAEERVAAISFLSFFFVFFFWLRSGE
ncbi:uncharacterized protein A4U43_C05F13450 [Asparagus officinalis]|uniref:Uncharacterized protein n=1 Tax=Asparagus officinalis TaxID=4686 RepID=A0A5P1EWS3_ASPOF|nr:uncharacterized protein A4U43_C05F13450 [Asparagus officinalis]